MITSNILKFNSFYDNDIFLIWKTYYVNKITEITKSFARGYLLEVGEKNLTVITIIFPIKKD